MARTVGIGHQNFEQLIAGNLFYVDKTMFIKEWWENGDAVTLITRPRRFGKTLNLNMTERFFSMEYAGQGDVFYGLAIWQEERYRVLQGTFPVISLSFAEVKQVDYDSAAMCINQLITDLYRKNAFLLQGELLSEEEKSEYRQVSMDMPAVVASRSLHKLSEYLYRYYKKKVLILLDEYDTPMQEAFVGGYWDSMISLIRTLFNSTFKTNPYLERALLTGITRVSKESIFSDLNNLEVITTTSEKYEAAFGFTEEEVQAALAEYGLPDKMKQVRDWYDGFTFGKRTDIYNPWSILNYLDKKRFAPYWANTSSNSLACKLIREGSPQIKVSMEELLTGGTLYTQLEEQIVFEQLNQRENAIWSLLLAAGYLKIMRFTVNEERGKIDYELVLTNKETRLLFEHMIGDWFAEYTPAYNVFVKALLLGDLEAMNEYMNRITEETFSYFDAGRNPSQKAQPERFYHGFVLGLLIDLRERYTLTSNRESGFGRYDIMLEPKRETDDAMILEFKVFQPSRENTLADTVRAALAQIEEKRYTAALTAKGIEPKRIRRYGFAFDGKTVLIGEGFPKNCKNPS